MVFVKGADHHILVAKAESSSFTMVACKTCSKTTKIWDKDPALHNSSEKYDDDEEEEELVIEKTKKGNKPKKNKKISSPSEIDNIPDHAENIIGELNNLTKRMIEDSSASNLADENDDGSNKVDTKSLKEINESKLSTSKENNDSSDGESGNYLPNTNNSEMAEENKLKVKRKGKKHDNSTHGEELVTLGNAISEFTDRNYRYYYGTEKVIIILIS
jgi:hypothetical protein